MSLLNNPEFLAKGKAEVLAYIDHEINYFQTQIFGLEMGHDYLTRADRAQINAWNDQIKKLQDHRKNIQPEGGA